MSIKWTDEAVKNWIDDNVAKDCFVGMERVTFDNGTRKQMRTRVFVRCVKCGTIFKKDWDEYRRKKIFLCKNCSLDLLHLPKIRTDDYISDFVKNNSCAELIKIERRKSRPPLLTLKCTSCGIIYKQNFTDFSRENGCRVCPSCTNKIRRETWDNTRAQQNNLLEKCPQISTIWSNKNPKGPESYSYQSQRDAYFKCNKCGNEWIAQIASVARSLKNGRNGCGKCLRKKAYTKQDFLEDLGKLNPTIELLGSYANLTTHTSFRCKVCGNIWEVPPNRLIPQNSKTKPTGCPVCSRKAIGPPPEYLNSIWANDRYREEWSLYFDEDFMKTHTIQSCQYVEIKCPDCGKIKRTKICNLAHRGFRCSCNRKTSYPNKFIYSVLDQLGVEYESEYNREWSKMMRYDIAIPSLSLIVENHGIQHYKDGIFTNRTLEENQEIDKIKKDLALANGFVNYIVLDCQKAEVGWIKKSIMESELPKLLRFSECDVDWDKADVFACGNTIREICEDWDVDFDIERVSKSFHVSKSTVQGYLLIGHKYAWCSYDPKWHFRPVFSPELNRRFGAMYAASTKYGIKCSDILCCCECRKESAGINPQTGLPLTWRYADDYVANMNESDRIQTQDKEK